MTGQFKNYSRAAIAYFAVLLSVSAFISASVSTAIAQGNPSLPPLPNTTPLPSPEPPPPMTTQEAASMRKFVKEEIHDSKEVGDQIQQEVDRSFGWTLSLLNTLIMVLIAIPIVTGLAALWLRRSLIDQVVRDIQKEVELIRAQWKVQAAKELKEQLEGFKKDLKRSQSEFAAQLKILSPSARAEKDRIFQELSRIMPSVIQEELASPETQAQIQRLTQQLDVLKDDHPQLVLTAEEYADQGRALNFEKRYDDALDAFARAIELQPELTEAWLGKAKVLRRLKRYEEAFLANDKAIELTANQPLEHGKVWHERGNILKNIKRYSEAVDSYGKAINLNQNSSDSWKMHGYVLTKLGHYPEALASLEKGIELNPTLGGSYYNLAYFYAAQGESELAIASLVRAIELYPKFKETLGSDPDFASLRTDDRFRQLLSPAIAYEQPA